MTTARALSIGFVGNVVTNPFGKVTARIADLAAVSVEHFLIGQIEQVLAGPASVDVLVVHLDHRWFFDVAPDEAAVARARGLAELVAARLARAPGTLILNTVPFVPVSSVESDLHDQLEALARINAVLFDLARSHEQVSIIDAAGTLAVLGFANALRERNRYMYQMPYAPAAVDALVERYADAIAARLRARRKVVVVDADNTLWSGVVGEDGVENLEVDSDYPGIVHMQLQRQLMRLKGLGILLCAVTKNNEEDFRAVFAQRAMPLRLEDFVAYRSNWSEKSENIRDLAATLNLGLDSFIFLDDNPFEIEEVRARLPGVECHLFDRTRPEQALTLLDGIASLRARNVTAEDLAKTEQYRGEAQRQELQRSAASMDEYLASLEVRVHIARNNLGALRRATQLINKTNQFNLTTRRYTEDEVATAMREGSVYTARVIDRFGDMGIVCVAIVRGDELETFLMSCRALGRRIEAQILRYVCQQEGERDLKARYRPSAKNRMVETFLDNNGFAVVSSGPEGKAYRLTRGPDDTPYIHIVAE
ncbi:HAD-IIIC family phosphatase [Methylobacterium sp. J-088]|uniref:HAD-IIIC family phosphatase n=1 Tax=Methylobacterium sp. J-088 TaxID=2836664 RepID=UPI001FB9A43D|nr:HAD-IIIC family phosphatase [Methylobacterium sp. J-088]MCJ2064296.1 HAD-IIIC family phosphatase [Methylobacterium sp. J-088]